MTRIIGIDYSLSCPCICVSDSDDVSLSNCVFYFLHEKSKYHGWIDEEPIHYFGSPHLHYDNETQRYDQISNWAMNVIDPHLRNSGVKIIIGLEDYAFSQLGQLTKLAENAGLLKYKLYKKNIDVVSVGPTQHMSKFKKGYDLKGITNNKEKMYVAFSVKTGVTLKEVFKTKAKQIGSPISDIVDSYSIMLYLTRVTYGLG